MSATIDPNILLGKIEDRRQYLFANYRGGKLKHDEITHRLSELLELSDVVLRLAEDAERFGNNGSNKT